MNRDPVVEAFLVKARQHSIPEQEAVAAWEEMRRQHRLPLYVRPALEERASTLVLVPAVDINLVSRLDTEVPGWERITGRSWPVSQR